MTGSNYIGGRFAKIRASLGVSIGDLVRLLEVRRGDIYEWIRGDSLPKQIPLDKISRLIRISTRWDRICNLPASDFCEKEGGVTSSGIFSILIKNLSEEETLLAIEMERHRYIVGAIYKGGPGTNLEIMLEKNGIDITNLPSNDEQFDLITGKSNFFGE